MRSYYQDESEDTDAERQDYMPEAFADLVGVPCIQESCNDSEHISDSGCDETTEST